MKNNIIKIIVGVIILAVIILAGVLWQNNNEDNNSNTTESTNTTVEETDEISIITIIDSGDTKTSYDKNVSSGTTALEVLNLVSEEDGIVLGTTEYDFGIMIDSIDGVGENVDDGKYWSFYVNDEMSMVGLTDYTVSDNDVILMKYQAL